MKTLKKFSVEVEEVKTKMGALLYKINLSPTHFFLEQNPLKDSKYALFYKELKAKYPDFYMFWEFENGDYTGRILTGMIMKKEGFDDFARRLLEDKKSY